MKRLVIAALVSTQMLAATQPVSAADFVSTETQRPGAFAGLRLRVPLGGDPRQRQLRAGLTLAPTVHSRAIDGATRARIGEGLELGFARNGRPALSLAGMRLDRLGADQDTPERAETPDEQQQRVGRTILKGAAVVAIVGAAVVGGLFLAFTVACDDNRCSE
jgi:hypothetical protein